MGIRVVRDRKQRKVWILQDAYIDRIVRRFGLQNRPYVSIPLTSIPSPNRGPTATKTMQLEYLIRIGSVTHPAVITRPDIANSSSILASFSSNPSQEHMALVERSIVYLRDHKYLAIEFDGTEKNPADLEVIFKGASDASFADDIQTRQSTEGYLFKFFGGALDWKSRKQRIVVTSTTEAELISLQHAAKEIQAWHHLFRDMEFDPEQPDNYIECDNHQTVRLVNLDRPIIRTNIRHLNIGDLWIRQEQREGRIQVTWVNSDKMDADGLTKPLSKGKFDQFVKRLGMRDIRSLIT